MEIIIWTLIAIGSWASVFAQLRQRRVMNAINADARRLRQSAELYLDIEKARSSGKLNDWAKAASIDPTDSMFANMSMQEFYEVIQVRISDRAKQIRGENA